MEIGKHLSKGIWGLADKALPVFYGIGYVLLVIRVLPEEEFGNFVLIQEIFLIVSGLATAFALQPLVKFCSEAEADDRSNISASLLFNGAFTVAASLPFLAGAETLSRLLNSPSLAPLMVFVPAMLAASFLRNFTLALLQAKFRIQEVFWTDAAHFLGAPFLTWVVSRMHLFSTARDLILINIVSLSASSVLGWILSRGLISVTLRPGRAVMERMWEYGKYSVGGIISYLGYTKADTFIVSMVGGPIQVAVYNSAKVFVRVYEMVAQVVQLFLLPATSRLSSKGEWPSLKALVEKSILFFTIAMAPVFILFLFLPSVWLTILYQGKYAGAIPLLQIFSFLSFIVPLMSIESNVLMGIGEVRANFVVGLQMLCLAIASYAIMIPLWGTPGAALAYLLTTCVVAWLFVVRANKFVPISFGGVFRRQRDLRHFIQSRIGLK